MSSQTCLLAQSTRLLEEGTGPPRPVSSGSPDVGKQMRNGQHSAASGQPRAGQRERGGGGVQGMWGSRTQDTWPRPTSLSLPMQFFLFIRVFYFVLFRVALG